MARPSYLYGTMHLTDKRLFQLGDSVYKAIEQTDGFAAELDMDHIGTLLVNEFLQKEENSKSIEPKKIKDLVDDKTWHLYSKQLETKLGKSADQLTVKDLDKAESRMYRDAFRKGDMPTFLDAWLFGQARSQGKWVGGIEDMEDQTEFMDREKVEEKIQSALTEEYGSDAMEKFIRIYSSQNLDSISYFMYGTEGSGKDYLMVKRNIKMARRMDSLSAIRSMVFAVGAGHLPGDSGVIALLRKRGFTVTPVISSKKVSADAYKPKTVAIPWKPVSIKEDVYTLEMPGSADALNMMEDIGMDMKMFFDLSVMKMYMTMNLDLPSYSGHRGGR